MYSAITCGRSNALEAAIDDLAFLDNLSKVKGKTRVSGRFRGWMGPAPNTANILVKFEGEAGTFTTKTDEKGFLDLYDIPAGDYLATIDVPLGWKINDYMIEHTSTGFEEYDPRARPVGKNQIPIRVSEGRHTALDIYFDLDTAIKGVVLSPAGEPMKGVCVKAVRTELAEGDYRGPFDCTNEKGEFVIEEMRDGNYILVANDDGKMSSSNPFGVIFYPGVADRKDAGIVPVERGKYATGRVIQIPYAVELVAVKGRFLFADGRPVIGETLKFTPADKERFDDIRVESGEGGAFTFNLPTGADGEIGGEIYIYQSKFAGCTEIEKMIEENGSQGMSVKSSIVSVKANLPIDQVEIKMPFKSCEVKK